MFEPERRVLFVLVNKSFDRSPRDAAGTLFVILTAGKDLLYRKGCFALLSMTINNRGAKATQKNGKESLILRSLLH